MSVDGSWVDLLTRLVSWDSVTKSPGEAKFPEHLRELLSEMPVFRDAPDAVRLHPTGDGRQVLTALLRAHGAQTPDTVVLLAHYDVVGVEDYGPLAALAFDPKALTEALRRDPSHLEPDVREDLLSGRYLFGRGVMDMKGGLAAHVTLLREMAAGRFDPGGNLLLLAVPDEEVNSVGMRQALEALRARGAEEHLRYRLVLNAEPVFPRAPGDRTQYLYTGSMGKILAGFYCLGQVTHVGESLAGMNANAMAAAVTAALEWHPALVARHGDETTPPPTNLLQYGLAERYSVQIPFRAVTLSNILLYDQPLHAVLDTLAAIAREAATRLERRHQEAVQRFGGQAGGVRPIRVWTYQELRDAAVERVGREQVDATVAEAISHGIGDERARAVQAMDRVAALVPDEAPLLVLFLAPPYYPAVNFEDHPRVMRIVEAVNGTLVSQKRRPYTRQAFYGGLSDLSFVGDPTPPDTAHLLRASMPGWGTLFDIPASASVLADVPGMNIGPVGFDAHQASERVDVQFGEEALLPALQSAVKAALARD